MEPSPLYTEVERALEKRLREQADNWSYIVTTPTTEALFANERLALVIRSESDGVHVELIADGQNLFSATLVHIRPGHPAGAAACERTAHFVDYIETMIQSIGENLP